MDMVVAWRASTRAPVSIGGNDGVYGFRAGHVKDGEAVPGKGDGLLGVCSWRGGDRLSVVSAPSGDIAAAMGISGSSH